MTPGELKESLKKSGFEVYRVKATDIFLAERVRENLILDAGIRVAVVPAGFSITVTCRAERVHFPGEADSTVFEHAEALAEPFRNDGFVETERRTVPITDPMNAERVLDTFFEIVYEKTLASMLELEAACHAALARARTAH